MEIENVRILSGQRP